MALDVKFYLVTKDVAKRTGNIQNHYKTEDGRYVFDKKTLSVSGIADSDYGVKEISREEAQTLIARGGYHLGE